MKAYVFLIFVLCVNQALAVVDENCVEPAKNYLVKGDINSTFGGDRLWSLERINRDFQQQKNSDCLGNIRTNAIADAREYWQGYISTKYSCNSADSTDLPQEKPAACPESKWNLIKKNMDYIEAIENGKAAPAGAARVVKKNPCAQKVEPTQRLREVSQAVMAKAAPPDPCAKYGIKAENLKNAIPSDKDMGTLKSCLVGSVKGVKGLVDVFKTSYSQLAGFISDPGYRASVMAALSDFMTVISTAPGTAMKAIYDAITTQLREYKSELQCQNTNGIVTEICNQITEKGLPSLLGIGAIRNIVLLAKSGKRAATGLVIVKDAAQAVSASETAALGTAAGAATGAATEAAESAAGLGANKAATQGMKAAAESRSRASATAKAQAEAKAKAAAEAKLKAEAEARAKAEVEAKARAQAEAETKARTEEEAKAKTKATRNKIDLTKDAAQIRDISSANVKSLEDVKRVLKLDPGMTKDEVKKEIRKLTGKYHPDKNPDMHQISTQVTGQLNKMRFFTDN
jgi:hypothetical protein